jgi:hypothetical protein
MLLQWGNKEETLETSADGDAMQCRIFKKVKL